MTLELCKIFAGCFVMACVILWIYDELMRKHGCQ
jgi:hypothetical protein